MNNPITVLRDAVATGDLEEVVRALREIDGELTGAHAPFGQSAIDYENRRQIKAFLTQLQDEEAHDPMVVVILGDGGLSRLLVFKDTRRDTIVAHPTTGSTELVKARWAKLTRGEIG